MSERVQLIGLDFGTTTSSAVVASARLVRNCVTGRRELDEVEEAYRSELVFTPLQVGRLDEERLEALLESWLAGVNPEQVFGGGALLTGLTAQRENATAIVALVRRKLGDTLVASADDPCLESWLAFLGSCAGLSRAHPATWFVNIDIGGGTTNLALGRDGEVVRTGCLFVGARHVQVEPGSYRIVQLSRYARALFEHLQIDKKPGDELAEPEVERLLDYYLWLLQEAVAGRLAESSDQLALLHQQVPFRLPADVGSSPDIPLQPGRTGMSGLQPGRTGMSGLRVTFSGGVGELVYRHVLGQPWPSTTYYGDLGIDLARRIVECPDWRDDLRAFQPASGGRATVYGLLRHSTEVSGSTLYLPHPECLPLTNVPIVGRVTLRTSENQMATLVDLVRRCRDGGCLLVELDGSGADRVREFGGKLGRILQESAFPAGHPLVLVVRDNVGKILGQYISGWGARPWRLVVLDEVTARAAQFVHIGVPHPPLANGGVLPVSFFGLHERGDAP